MTPFLRFLLLFALSAYALASSISTYGVCNTPGSSPGVCPGPFPSSVLSSSDTRAVTQLGYGLRVSAPVRIQRSFAVSSTSLLLVLSHNTTVRISTDLDADSVLLSDPAPDANGIALVLIDWSTSPVQLLRVVTARNLNSLQGPYAVQCDHITQEADGSLFAGFRVSFHTALTVGGSLSESRLVLTQVFPSLQPSQYAVIQTGDFGITFIAFTSDLVIRTSTPTYEVTSGYPRGLSNDAFELPVVFTPTACSADYHVNSTYFESHAACRSNNFIWSSTIARRLLNTNSTSFPTTSEIAPFFPAQITPATITLYQASVELRWTSPSSTPTVLRVTKVSSGGLYPDLAPVIHLVKPGTALFVPLFESATASIPAFILFRGPYVCTGATCTELHGVRIVRDGTSATQEIQVKTDAVRTLVAGSFLLTSQLQLRSWNLDTVTSTVLQTLPFTETLLLTVGTRLFHWNYAADFHVLSIESAASLPLSTSVSLGDLSATQVFVRHDITRDVARVITYAVGLGTFSSFASPVNRTLSGALFANDGRKSRRADTISLTIQGNDFALESPVLYAPLPSPRGPNVVLPGTTGVRMAWTGTTSFESSQGVIAHSRVWLVASASPPTNHVLLNAANSLAMGGTDGVQGLLYMACCSQGQHVRWNTDLSPAPVPDPWSWSQGTATQTNCPSSQSGARCEWTSCATDGISQCQNGGVCTFSGCTCAMGYTGDYCDVSPCQANSMLCQPGGQCQVSTTGAPYYTCSCLGGYTTSSDGLSCLPPCSAPGASTFCTPFAPPATQYGVCVNPGQGSCPSDSLFYCCQCGQGFELAAGPTCVDVDECLTQNGGCDLRTTCTNTPGSRVCSACPAGFTGTGETVCVDVNECATNNGGCDGNVQCNNFPGGYDCGAGRCPTGYYGDPNVPNGCVDIDECALYAPCDAPRVCINSPGSFSCSDCPSGFAEAPAAFGETCFEPRNWTVSPIQIQGAVTIKKRQLTRQDAWHLFVEYSTGFTIATGAGATLATVDVRRSDCPSYAWVVLSTDYSTLVSVTVVDAFSGNIVSGCFSGLDFVALEFSDRAYALLDVDVLRYQSGIPVSVSSFVSVRCVFPPFGVSATIQPLIPVPGPGLSFRQHVVISFRSYFVSIVNAIDAWVSSNGYGPGSVRARLGAQRRPGGFALATLVIASGSALPTDDAGGLFSYTLQDLNGNSALPGPAIFSDDGRVAVFTLEPGATAIATSVLPPFPRAFFRDVAAATSQADTVLVWTSPSTGALGQADSVVGAWSVVWTSAAVRVELSTTGSHIYRAHVVQARASVSSGYQGLFTQDLTNADDSFLRISDYTDALSWGGSVLWPGTQRADISLYSLEPDSTSQTGARWVQRQSFAEGYQRHMIVARASLPGAGPYPVIPELSGTGATAITIVGTNWATSVAPTYACGLGQPPASTACSA